VGNDALNIIYSFLHQQESIQLSAGAYIVTTNNYLDGQQQSDLRRLWLEPMPRLGLHVDSGRETK